MTLSTNSPVLPFASSLLISYYHLVYNFTQCIEYLCIYAIMYFRLCQQKKEIFAFFARIEYAIQLWYNLPIIQLGGAFYG